MVLAIFAIERQDWEHLFQFTALTNKRQCFGLLVRMLSELLEILRMGKDEFLSSLGNLAAVA